MPATSTHAANVVKLVEAGITRGGGDATAFCPDRDVTRQEMASFLARALDL